MLLEGEVAFGGFADVVSGCLVVVGCAGWASGAGSGGFGCGCWLRDVRVEVGKPSSDAGGGQSAGFGGWFLPGSSLVFGEWAG